MGKKNQAGSMPQKASGSKKKISTQLLLVLLPMIAVFIIVPAIVIFVRSQSVIIEKAQADLEDDSRANANDISAVINNIKGYYDGVADIISQSHFESDEQLINTVKIVLDKFEETPTGLYMALSDKTYLDPSGWVPDSDYDPTTRDWYIEGAKNDVMTLSDPYLDMDSGSMVVAMGRKLTLQDGREGVLSSDVFLEKISSAVAEYTPGDTGQAILFDRNMILASVQTEYNGTEVSEHSDDAFITALGEKVANCANDIQTIKGNDNKMYYVSFDPVPGTTWTMVSYVPKADVLKELSSLNILTIIIVIIMLIVSVLVIMYLVRRMITAPVAKLTNTIVKIADGDFTVDIGEGGVNEIGVMNNRMHDYVIRMRDIMGEMKEQSSRLSDEAGNSRKASESMNEQADRQSDSMSRINDSMDQITKSVTELANNATELAQAVNDVSEQGNVASDIMNNLLEKAKQGQSDMTNVQNNMNNISHSMTEMSDVVKTVDEAAKKINSIVEIINSISSQTNLLSLNASIEAARAGEAGKGFAVVATEIGNLANESADATTEISGIITEITAQIRNLSERSEASVNDISVSNEAVKSTGNTFAEIFEALDNAGITINDMITKMYKVNDIAASVAAISEQQAASTEFVSSTVVSAASSAQDVASESRNVDASAATVSQSADKISEFVNSFKI